jgi:hypothetical protein
VALSVGRLGLGEILLALAAAFVPVLVTLIVVWLRRLTSDRSQG